MTGTGRVNFDESVRVEGKQEEPARNPSAHTNLKSLETIMKIMAIGTLKPLTADQRQKYLPAEVPATLQLYLDGKMEQFWLRDKEAGVIFLMTVESVDEADRLLRALPLGQADLLTFELMPVGPLLPLGMLMKAK